MRFSDWSSDVCSSDLRYEPDHMLLRAAWEDARTRLTDVGRLADLLNRSNEAIVHKALDRVSPMSVPLMMIIGRESVRQEATEDMLLAEADALVDRKSTRLNSSH